MKYNQKGFSIVEILIIIVIIVLIGTVGWLVYDRQKSKNNETTTNVQTQQENKQVDDKKEEKTEKPLTKGTFGSNGEYGTLQIEGYPSMVMVDEALCEQNCQQYEYVFFNITRTENQKIYDYLKSIEGNSFVSDSSIGIGCLADGKITYYNSSDAKGAVEYSINSEDTTAIMNATSENPIVLDIERLQLTGGSGAPTCYSHFTTFSVAN